MKYTITCQGYSFISVSIPPTILFTRLGAPHWHSDDMVAASTSLPFLTLTLEYALYVHSLPEERLAMNPLLLPTTGLVMKHMVTVWPAEKTVVWGGVSADEKSFPQNFVLPLIGGLMASQSPWSSGLSYTCQWFRRKCTEKCICWYLHQSFQNGVPRLRNLILVFSPSIYWHLVGKILGCLGSWIWLMAHLPTRHLLLAVTLMRSQ